MEVILLEHVNKLGRMGDKVNVKNGYARNYLLPTKKALRATAENLAFYEKQKAELEAHNKALFESASKQSEELQGFKVVLIRQAAETGQLYGSVTIRVYQVKLSLHPEVSQTILVNVARTDDEAKKQENAFNKE